MRETGQEQAAGAARGTVYHHVLECLNYRAAAEHLADLPKDYADKNAGGTGHPKTAAALCAEVERQIGSMVSRGILSREDASCVRPEDIAAFLASPIGRRMATAALSGQLRREQPFVIDIAAKDIDRSWPEDENILVQGTIDAYFEEDGQYVLVDYKTDRVFSADGSDLVEKYQKQLEFYRLALERIAGIPVKEMYIYSVTLGKQIPVAG
jgi:ATP-dependent helicase/nuclease subunit A